jgi:hypothetical protein
MEEVQYSLSLKPSQGENVTGWRPIFNLRNRRIEDRLFEKCLAERNVERNLLEVFLQNNESAVPSWEVEQARKYLREASRRKVAHAQLITHARAWVESRRKLTDHCRGLPQWLSPNELGDFLRQRVRLASGEEILFVAYYR